MWECQPSITTENTELNITNTCLARMVRVPGGSNSILKRVIYPNIWSHWSHLSFTNTNGYTMVTQLDFRYILTLSINKKTKILWRCCYLSSLSSSKSVKTKIQHIIIEVNCKRIYRYLLKVIDIWLVFIQLYVEAGSQFLLKLNRIWLRYG